MTIHNQDNPILISSSSDTLKTPRYVLSGDIVRASSILSGWNAAHLISNATNEETVIPIADFAKEENYVMQSKARRKAIKWLTLMTMWALQEGLSSVLTKQIVEEHLEDFKHYISVDSATWDDFVHAFFIRHKVDGATQFVQWYRHQRALGRNTWFAYEELERATNKFSRALKYAEGTKGIVYKGVEQFSHQFIAVKRLKKVSSSSLRKLLYEVTVHHFIKNTLNFGQMPLTLVELIGFCPNLADPLLVFEFVPNGNLQQHLQGHYGKYLHSHALARLSIAIDVADALKHLHYNSESPVYHRDIKSSGILLNNSYRAKLADLSTAQILRCKSGSTTELACSIIDDSDKSYAETIGTPGYVDPAYNQTRQSNISTDVYSFGVVLIELATHLKAWDTRRPVKLLTDMVQEKLMAGKLNEIVTVSGASRAEGLATMKLMLLLGLDCCTLDLKKRPTIDEVQEALHQLRPEEHLDDVIAGIHNDDPVDPLLAAVGDSYQKLTLASMVERR